MSVKHGGIIRLLPVWLLSAAALLASAGLLPAETAHSRPAATATAKAPATGTAPSSATSASRPSGRGSAFHRELEALFKAGRYAEARDLLKRELQRKGDSPGLWYNLACAYSRLGEIQQALDCLDKAIANGYTAIGYMERDEDLAALRSEPHYQQLLARRDEIQRQRAERILAELRARFGDKYICEIDENNRIVVATDIDRQSLEELKGRLSAQAEALWNDLFEHHFEQYVTVALSRDGKGLRPEIGGFYSHPYRTLVARTVGMTMMHEFTHALHAADLDALGQQHPLWVMEGLATLFETAKIEDGHIVPKPNHRLDQLKRLIDRRRTIPLKDLMAMDAKSFMAQATAAYSESRYLMMYLYDKGKLRAWYERYTSDYQSDPTGRKALEDVLEKPIDEVERNWLAWVHRQPVPPRTIRPNHAYLGVQTMMDPEGVRVEAVVTGSGAAEAGIHPGDFITQIDGTDVVEVDDVLQIVSDHDVGDSLELRIRRNGQYQLVPVLLKAMPVEKALQSQSASGATRPAGRPCRKPPPSSFARRHRCFQTASSWLDRTAGKSYTSRSCFASLGGLGTASGGARLVKSGTVCQWQRRQRPRKSPPSRAPKPPKRRRRGPPSV